MSRVVASVDMAGHLVGAKALVIHGQGSWARIIFTVNYYGIVCGDGQKGLDLELYT